MSDHFYLTLPSNSSMHVFPDNKISHFKTQLPKRISLQGEWELGLAEIHYPFDFVTIPSSQFWVGLEYNEPLLTTENVESENTKREETSKEDQGSGNMSWKKIHFKGDSFATIESLIAAMEKTEDFRRFATITCEKSCVRIKLKSGVSRMVLTPSLQRILGLHEMDVRTSVESYNLSNINACLPSQMFIYTDVIEHQHVGDVMAPLLRIVNIESSQNATGKQFVSIFTHPHYTSVLKRDFQQIEIDIRDDLGKYVPFVRGSLNVKLHFRKIK